MYTFVCIWKYIVGDILIIALLFPSTKTTNNQQIYYDGNVNKLWNIHKMKYYVAVKKKEVDLYAQKWKVF